MTGAGRGLKDGVMPRTSEQGVGCLAETRLWGKASVIVHNSLKVKVSGREVDYQRADKLKVALHTVQCS